MSYRELGDNSTGPLAPPKPGEVYGFLDQFRCAIGRHNPSNCHFMIAKKVVLGDPLQFNERRILYVDVSKVFCRCCRTLVSSSVLSSKAFERLVEHTKIALDNWERIPISERYETDTPQKFDNWVTWCKDADWALVVSKKP
ncbi:MAG: hypothetical protein E6R04_01320 [Spirochaetes bacterium]|nr:MAG: hypothetical protein E6R04_01320 [Spirochaetota bacterium]